MARGNGVALQRRKVLTKDKGSGGGRRIIRSTESDMSIICCHQQRQREDVREKFWNFRNCLTWWENMNSACNYKFWLRIKQQFSDMFNLIIIQTR